MPKDVFIRVAKEQGDAQFDEYFVDEKYIGMAEQLDLEDILRLVNGKSVTVVWTNKEDE